MLTLANAMAEFPEPSGLGLHGDFPLPTNSHAAESFLSPSPAFGR